MTHQHIPDFESKLRSIVSHGLVSGLGQPEPGKLCIEAAICLALGEPHGDAPSCVAEPDRAFAIRLNDAPWSSPAARAEAMLPLALAQLGTVGRDRTAWVKAVVLGTVRRVLPLALKAVGLTKHAKACAKTLKEAESAAAAAFAAADAAYAAGDEVLRVAVGVALKAYAKTNPRAKKTKSKARRS